MDCVGAGTGFGMGMTAVVASAEEPVTISIMSTWSVDSQDATVGDKVARAAVDRVKADYPDLVIQEEVLAHDLYEDKLKTLMATDSLPDVFMSLSGLMPSMYANGQILDVKPLIQADPEWSGRMLEGSFGDFTFGDNWLAVPGSNIVCSMIVYNKAIFAECGITEFPATYEAFVDACAKIKAKGYIPISCGNKAGYMLTSQVFPSIMWKYVDLDWYQSLKDGTGAKFTDEPMVKAYTALKQLIDMGAFNEDLNSSEELLANAYYYNGKSAMMIGGFWITSFVNDNASEDVKANSDVAIMPPLQDKPENAKYLSGGQGWGTVLSSALTGKRLEAALALLKHFSDPDLQAMLAGGGSLPVAKAAEYDTSDMTELTKKMYKLFEDAVFVPNSEIQFNAAYVSAAEDAFQELSLGSITPEAMAELLQQKYEEGKAG